MDFLKEYEKWKNFDMPESELKGELLDIEGKTQEIKERFHKCLEFGTAGLRGIIGAGTNRMNVYTVRQATQGLSEYIKNTGEKDKGVVIAYDSRNYSDIFSLEAAKVLCANGIKTYLFDSLRPTPELSFAVLHLNAIAGIVITASHNPKEYNGYKVYGEDGGQIGLEVANKVTEEILKTDILTGALSMDEKQAEKEGLLVYIGEEVDKEYLKNVFNQSVNKEIVSEVSDNFSVVYTPFHGSGNLLVQKILSMAGLKKLLVVKEQEMPDGNFPTVKSPNPEDKEGFKIAIELAKKNDTDLIIGTDPDSDRVGIVVRDSRGEYVAFTGNQVGALLVDYILSQHKEKGTMPKNPVVIKSVVSTEMVRAIAAYYDVTMVEVLTGFKFIGEKIDLYNKDKSHTFLFGFEESYGYLSGTYAHDKDAVVASMLIVEMAAWYKKQGKTLFDALNSLYKKFGTYCEGTINIVEKGIEGPEKIRVMIEKIRTNCPEFIGKCKVSAIRDYQEGVVRYPDGSTKSTELPKNNMLYLELDDNKGWIALRPSGTEPKLKIYVGYSDMDENNAKETHKDLTEKIVEIIK